MKTKFKFFMLTALFSISLVFGGTQQTMAATPEIQTPPGQWTLVSAQEFRLKYDIILYVITLKDAEGHMIVTIPGNSAPSFLQIK